jgi:hypothetical protein
VLGQIQQTRQHAFAKANTALIDLYWSIRQTLSHKVAQAGWGKDVVTELARYIAQADPSIHGFSDKNLWRMKQFYEAYPGDEQLSALARVFLGHTTPASFRAANPPKNGVSTSSFASRKSTRPANLSGKSTQPVLSALR